MDLPRNDKIQFELGFLLRGYTMVYRHQEPNPPKKMVLVPENGARPQEDGHGLLWQVLLQCLASKIIPARGPKQCRDNVL